MLDPATSEIASGSKFGLASAKKIPGEGFKRPWPPLIKMDERVKAKTPSFPSAAAGGLDFGDVDLAHFHHRFEGAFGFSAAGRHRVRQHARRDLPGDSPAVFAPAACAFLAAVAEAADFVRLREFYCARRM